MPLIHGKSPKSFSKNVETEMHEGKPLKQSLAIAYAMKKRKKAYGGKMCAEGGDMDDMMQETASPSPIPDPNKKLISGMKKAFHSPGYAEGGHVKGVHTPIKAIVDDEHGMGEEAKGVSHAGILTRQGRGYSKKEEQERGYYADAKASHKKVLGEMHEMKGHDRKYLADGGFVHEEKESGYESMPHPCENCGHMNHIDSRMLGQHGAEEVAAEGMAEDNEPFHEREVSHPVENQDDHEDMVGRIMKQRAKHYSHGGKVSNEDMPIADSEEAEYDDLEKDDDLEFHDTGANSGDELGDKQEDEDRHDIVSRIMKSRKKKDRLPHPA